LSNHSKKNLSLALFCLLFGCSYGYTLGDMKDYKYYAPIAEAARHAGISRKTLYQWVKGGIVKRIARPGSNFGYVSTVQVLQAVENGPEWRANQRRAAALRAKYPHPKGTARPPKKMRVVNTLSPCEMFVRVGVRLREMAEKGTLSGPEAASIIRLAQGIVRDCEAIPFNYRPCSG
jgi:transposase-like protein